jgi:ketosteroid isomerase-like protein
MERADVERWITAYEAAWRSPGTDALATVFSPEVTYRASPWRSPIEGIDALARFWEAERDGPDEAFDLSSEIVAVDGATAVARIEVTYAAPTNARWRDLWIMTFAADGRCRAFEEWPFSPRQSDGH